MAVQHERRAPDAGEEGREPRRPRRGLRVDEMDGVRHGIAERLPRDVRLRLHGLDELDIAVIIRRGIGRADSGVRGRLQDEEWRGERRRERRAKKGCMALLHDDAPPRTS